MEVKHGNLYDYPRYYDLIYGSDWKAEFDFLQACFQAYAKRPVRRLFEPACGTGRLMFRFAKVGYEVSGLDLNSRAVDYCNARLERHGFPATAWVGDMSDFRLPRKVDAAFNTVSSFRHLITERTALGHLQCVAESLAKGGLYVLGFHLTPTTGRPLEEESWSARRGHLAVCTHLWTTHRDLKHREEHCSATHDIYTPTKSFRMLDEIVFRTYTLRQFRALLRKTPALEVVETFDFAYEIDNPHKLGSTTEDVVFILRKV